MEREHPELVEALKRLTDALTHQYRTRGQAFTVGAAEVVERDVRRARANAREALARIENKEATP